MGLAKTFILLFVTVIQIFVFCETSERMSIEFDKIDFYGDWNWYSFPMTVRRILPIIILNAQVPMTLSGAGNEKCSRETFKKVSY